jgi:hypothetical protein
MDKSKIYAVECADEGEGIVAIGVPGLGMLPLVFHDPTKIKRYWPQILSSTMGRKVKILRYENPTEIKPSDIIMKNENDN